MTTFEPLSRDDDRIVRNVRAAALWFVILGSLFLLVGVALLCGWRPKSDAGKPDADNPILVGAFGTVIGACGVIGGAGLRKRRKAWARAIYPVAILYLLAFPIGTILSYVVLKYQGAYWRIVKRTHAPT